MAEDDDKVKRLPVRFKKPPAEDGLMLKVVGESSSEGCNHKWFFVNNQIVDVTYQVREGETEVECGNCGTRLDPMWVIVRLAREETQWQRTQQRYHEEMARIDCRSKTKCQHCGKMTRISDTKPRKAG